MKFNKKLTTFLSLLLLVFTIATYGVMAADDEIDYLKLEFASVEEKLENMELMLTANGSELYVDRVSGEIAFKDIATGEVLLSNPYDVSSSSASDNKKNELLSQLIIKFEENGTEKTLDSYFSAAKNRQITVKKTKTGVRVEYIIGEQVPRRLLPKMIEKSRFEELIFSNFPDYELVMEKYADLSDIKKDIAVDREAEQFYISYLLKDPNDSDLTQTSLKEMQRDWPITESMAVYVLDTSTTSSEEKNLENLIKEYAPGYTFEMLDEDHEMTRYENTEKSPPLFRMALEYSIDENGNLDVRLPANGIRFDETVYSLTSVQILPFFGAGISANNGEIFIPDGSGAIIRPADFESKPITLTNKIYGQDYAYQTVAGAHQEVMHMPVYGVVQNIIEEIETKVTETVIVEQENDDGEIEKVETAEEKIVVEEKNKKLGFVAIIEEGDSLATVTARNGGNEFKYFTAFTSFSPRPKDTYNLSAEASGAQHTIVSDRKYTGSYRIKYVMLVDEEVAAENDVADAYEPSYVGMAHAYRDYLIDEGVLTKLDDTTVKSDIPLYIESFGSVETTERFLTIPITVLKALTTFDNLKTMTEELAAASITNVNYKLTGYTNGGMVPTAPTQVEFDDAVGGDDGFKSFVKYANEKGINVFPDFDFVYLHRSEMFDDFDNKDLVKTMDGRYISKRYYDSTTQTFEKNESLAISPSSFDAIYDLFQKDYKKLGNTAMAVSTLGSDLNSDFDEKEPYNREDSKQFVKDVLERIGDDYSQVLSDSANAYTLQYVDHYINVPLDSSNYIDSSASVPFMGIVLHGYKNFAGTAVNMAGDIDYQLLKTIENGSSLYFLLSYDNTRLLKESESLNKYYSVKFEYWIEDLVEAYTSLNEVLKDCQTSEIVDHEFIFGYRHIEEGSEEAIEDAQARAALEESIAASNLEKYNRAKKALQRQTLKSGGNPETVVFDEAEFYASPEIADANEKERAKFEESILANYLTDQGKIVVVTYANGVKFILNYNTFAVDVEINGETVVVDALGFYKTNV